MKFSKRIGQIKPSSTLAVTALANSLKSKGIDVVGFGSGEPDFDTPDHIKEAAIKAIRDGKTKYTPAGGINELKEAIVYKFKRDNNLQYKTSEVIVNCGGKHSFYNLMQVMLNNGDEVIIPAPYWVSYPAMVMLAGGKPVIIDTNEKNGFKLKPAQIKNAITNRTKAILINSPSNPTGATYTKKELEELVKVLLKYDIPVITDDIYEFFLYSNEKFYNVANLSEELKKRTIVLNGVSKTYSMPGWRIGYMACDEEIIKKIDIIQSQSTSNPTSISQWASIEALKGDQACVHKMLEAFTGRRTIIVEKLNEIPGIECLAPGGSFYVFPNVKGVFKHKGWNAVKKKYGGESNSSILSSYLLEEARVAVVPSLDFGTDSNIRLSFATSGENILKGMVRIKEAISRLV